MKIRKKQNDCNQNERSDHGTENFRWPDSPKKAQQSQPITPNPLPSKCGDVLGHWLYVITLNIDFLFVQQTYMGTNSVLLMSINLQFPQIGTILICWPPGCFCFMWSLVLHVLYVYSEIDSYLMYSECRLCHQSILFSTQLRFIQRSIELHIGHVWWK